MVKPKKHLGQHFLTDDAISHRVVSLLDDGVAYSSILELGPGTGALTQFLIKQSKPLFVLELDQESIGYLKQNYPSTALTILQGDFLKVDLNTLFSEPFVLVGNFPYNISSQIMFKVLDYKESIPLVVGMFQKEVAERIASPPGSKQYGILSVLLQTWYNVEYVFTVDAEKFDPPPKVQSGVIRLKRNQRLSIPIPEKFFKQVVKSAFNQRRKTLRNALKSILPPDLRQDAIFNKRAEELSVDDFIAIAKSIHNLTV
jgi:16S rRNA (adenine1518-N6/adenine1519-N6)-dimethyltransferase